MLVEKGKRKPTTVKAAKWLDRRISPVATHKDNTRVCRKLLTWTALFGKYDGALDHQASPRSGSTEVVSPSWTMHLPRAKTRLEAALGCAWTVEGVGDFARFSLKHSRCGYPKQGKADKHKFESII